MRESASRIALTTSVVEAVGRSTVSVVAVPVCFVVGYAVTRRPGVGRVV